MAISVACHLIERSPWRAAMVATGNTASSGGASSKGAGATSSKKVGATAYLGCTRQNTASIPAPLRNDCCLGSGMPMRAHNVSTPAPMSSVRTLTVVIKSNTRYPQSRTAAAA